MYVWRHAYSPSRLPPPTVHGPTHIGVAVPLEAGDRFGRVALVYYPAYSISPI
jgi:hypothetical protein